MKKLFGIFMIVCCLALGYTGCKKKDNPTTPIAPAANTPTFTPSVTRTITSTPTNQITSTATSSPTVTSTPTVTTSPTFVPTPAIVDFEDGSADYFYDNNPSANSGCYNLVPSAPGYNSTYGLGVSFISKNCNDAQIAVSSSPGFPYDFAAMNATGVRCYIYSNSINYATDATIWISACPLIETNGGNYGGLGGTSFGGCYGGWTNQNAQQVSQGGWVQITLSPSSSPWSTQKADVTKIGVEINQDGLKQNATSSFVIDNVEVF
jgi:hypothetical protein